MKQKLKSVLCLLLFLCLAAPSCGMPQTVSNVSVPSPRQIPSQTASGAAKASSPRVGSPSAPASSETGPGDTSNLSLEQKVGQMFFLCFRKNADGTDLRTDSAAVRGTIRSIRPGGIVLFGENIHTVGQVRRLIRDMQEDCSTPPFIGIDQEGGTVQRIRKTALIPAVTVPSMWAVGKTGDLALARSIGEVLGSELAVFGFNLDFAPDCDVLTNPGNTVIGTRAFSSDPQKAASFSVAVGDGIRSQGIIPVCKHFPGHGGTAADTHEGYAAVSKTLDELRQTELVPFRAQIKSGAEMILAAHISLPKIVGDNTPATLSPKVIQDLLRGELGFHGVIITDAMNMGAVADHYSSGEAAVLAVNAGVDMLLMPADPQAAYSAVLNAVKSGRISESRIDASAARILALKKKYGLFTKNGFGDESLLGCKEHREIVARIKAD
jgi:beta-N-acetylhexosaminidase